MRGHWHFPPCFLQLFTRFPVTPNTRMKCIKMMSKQKAFLDNAKVVRTLTIAGIHAVIKKIGEHTLCQILMAVRSTLDPEKGLFIGIDELQVGGKHIAALTVHLDRCEEAIGIIPLSCIILEAKFGIASRQWFADESKAVDLKYKWDAVKGMVVPLIPEDDEAGFNLDSDDEHCTAMMDLLGVDSSGGAREGFVFNIDHLIDEVINGRNEHSDCRIALRFLRVRLQQATVWWSWHRCDW
jgi:hypothetical protein